MKFTILSGILNSVLIWWQKLLVKGVDLLRIKPACSEAFIEPFPIPDFINTEFCCPFPDLARTEDLIDQIFSINITDIAGFFLTTASKFPRNSFTRLIISSTFCSVMYRSLSDQVTKAPITTLSVSAKEANISFKKHPAVTLHLFFLLE